MMPHPRIARRHVLHVAGYEPISPDVPHARICRELKRFERTWSVAAAASRLGPGADADPAGWTMTACGPNWTVETSYELLWRELWSALFPAEQRASSGC